MSEDDIDDFVEKMRGENPFNETSDEVFIGNKSRKDSVKLIKALFTKLTSDCPIGTRGERGILYMGLLAKFEDFRYIPDLRSATMGLLGPKKSNLKLFIGPEGKDGGFDAFVVNDDAKRIIPVEAKNWAGKSPSRVPYDPEIKELLDDSKEKLHDGTFTGIDSGVKPSWVRTIKSMHRLFKKGYEIEPVFISNGFTKSAIAKIKPDEYPDLIIERDRNFIETKGFCEAASDVRADPIRDIPSIELRFPLDFIAKSSTVEEVGVNVLMGLVPLVDLVEHYKDGAVKPKLFARNVRFPQHDKLFRTVLKNTFKSQPHAFFVLNNGISATAIGSLPDNLGTKSKNKLKIALKKENLRIAGTREALIKRLNKHRQIEFSRFLIINGAQTISTAERLTDPVRTTEPVKLTEDCLVPIRITILAPEDEDKERKVITKISIANNRQRKIRNSDLFTNHMIHITLQRKLRKFGIFYERKDKEFKETAYQTADINSEIYNFAQCPIEIIKKDMKNNCLDSGKSKKTPLIRKNEQINTVGLIGLTSYVLAFTKRPIDARVNVQAQYESGDTHQALWCQHENSEDEDGADQEIGNLEFNHKLFCICAGAFLQICLMKGRRYSMPNSKLLEELKKENHLLSLAGKKEWPSSRATKPQLIERLNSKVLEPLIENNGARMDSMTVTQLKAELKKAKLPVSGNKPDLIKRLTDAKNTGGTRMDSKTVMDSMTVTQLKDELRNACLFVKGKKADLIKRLSDAKNTGALTLDKDLNLDKDLEKRFKKLYGPGWNQKELGDQEKNLIYEARWFFLHVFRKKFKKEIEDLIIVSTESNIAAAIDTFFGDAKKSIFVSTLPGKLIEAMEQVKDKVKDGEDEYEDKMIRRPGLFFQYDACLTDFEKTVGVYKK